MPCNKQILNVHGIEARKEPTGHSLIPQATNLKGCCYLRDLVIRVHQQYSHRGTKYPLKTFVEHKYRKLILRESSRRQKQLGVAHAQFAHERDDRRSMSAVLPFFLIHFYSNLRLGAENRGTSIVASFLPFLSTCFPPARSSCLSFGFHYWSLVNRWAQLLITSNYYLPSLSKPNLSCQNPVTPNQSRAKKSL